MHDIEIIMKMAETLENSSMNRISGKQDRFQGLKAFARSSIYAMFI